MRVCIISELNGGVGVYAQNLILGLRQLGARLTVVTPHPDPLTEVDEIIPIRASTGRARWLPHSYRFYRALLNNNQYDILHFTDARYSAFLRDSSIPVIGTMNDYFYAITSWFHGGGSWEIYKDWYLRHLYYNFTRVIESYSLPNLDKIICITQAVANQLQNSYGIAEDKLRIVNYGISYGPSNAEPFPKGGPVILFAGGNFQRKGLEVLILSSREVLLTIPNAKFVILGESVGATRMKQLANELGVEKSFEFIGQVDYRTLYRYYSTSDVFAMPSLLEAFGIPYLEAMHCGVPIVATRIPGPNEYLSHEINALLSEPGDPHALSQNILRAISDRSIRKNLIHEGYKTASLFTQERMARETAEVYESALVSRIRKK